METELLRVVSTENTGDLRIINNGENSYLVNGEIIVTEKENSSVRPLHCSELDKKLKLRNWHKFDTKFITASGELYTRMYSKIRPNSIIDVINTNPESEDIEKYSDYAFLSSDRDFNDLVNSLPDVNISEDEIETLYEKIFGAMKEKEISFYSIQKEVIDILDGSVVFDLIKYGSAEYTDTVSLGEVLRLPHAPTEYGRIDLGIQYTKLGEDGTFKIYCKETTFTAFTSIGGVIEVNNLVGDLNNEVQFELINEVIKVSPLTNDISECIISNCTLTYGRN